MFDQEPDPPCEFCGERSCPGERPMECMWCGAVYCDGRTVGPCCDQKLHRLEIEGLIERTTDGAGT